MAIEARIRELGVRHQSLERAIQDELAIPPRFVGIGEKVGDLHYFERDEFVAHLL